MTGMTAFVSWSGGKDCSLALYNFLQNKTNKVTHLVNIADRSMFIHTHCITSDLLEAQSEALQIPLVREEICAGNNYEFHLKNIITELKKTGVDTGIFGDIHLQEHRVWIERVCSEMGIKAVFPLWGLDTRDIIDSFAELGFKTRIIAVKDTPELRPLIGKDLDKDTIAQLKQIEGIDVCGEKGEYHSFVYQSPLYTKPVSFTQGQINTLGNMLVIGLNKINK